MTWKEKLQKEKPELVSPDYIGGCKGCPGTYFEKAKNIHLTALGCPAKGKPFEDACSKCWNSEIRGTESTIAACNKTCTNCKYLSRDADEEPCKSCNTIGRNPTNWVYRDNSDLEYNSETDRWEPKKQVYLAVARGNGKSMTETLTDIKKVYYAIDELHNVKNEERKPDMHPRSYYTFGNLTIAPTLPEIEDVIFNPPATIVFWKDKTKTVVKANNEEYDPEKGLAMAMIKKLYGNKGNYCNKLKKWTDRYPGETPAEKAERRDKQIREKLALAEAMLTTVESADSKMTKAEMRAYVSDALKLVGEALE